MARNEWCMGGRSMVWVVVVGNGCRCKSVSSKSTFSALQMRKETQSLLSSSGAKRRAKPLPLTACRTTSLSPSGRIGHATGIVPRSLQRSGK